MHDIVEPLKPHHASRHPVSRRALLEGSASAGLVAAAAGWGSAALRPNDANAADASPRQTAGFRMRMATAQAYLDEPQPVHRSNGDEARYADALSPTNPYRGSRTQFGDIPFGSKNLLSLLA